MRTSLKGSLSLSFSLLLLSLSFSFFLPSLSYPITLGLSFAAQQGELCYTELESLGESLFI